MLLYFIFPNDFDGALQVCLAMERDPNLSKTTLADDSPNLISHFDVHYFFETLEVLEIENMVKLRI